MASLLLHFSDTNSLRVPELAEHVLAWHWSTGCSLPPGMLFPQGSALAPLLSLPSLRGHFCNKADHDHPIFFAFPAHCFIF